MVDPKYREAVGRAINNDSPKCVLTKKETYILSGATYLNTAYERSKSNIKHSFLIRLANVLVKTYVISFRSYAT